MILLDLKGRLGNQMFEYAAIRTLAEEKGFGFACVGAPNLLQGAFFKSPPRLIGKIIRRLRDPLLRKMAPLHYTPPYIDYSPRCNMESFDPALADLSDRTCVSGWLQSHEYFQHNRAAVLRWFTPLPQHLKKIDALEASIPVPPEKRCCIHVRLTDYARADDGLAHGGTGWTLPRGYYEKALRMVPDDVHFVLISDDPESAARLIGHDRVQVVPAGNHAAVDMFLMARCRYNIIANSSFSWWGAWCNTLPGREIIAPLYHTGWPIRRWCPDRLEVPGWRYLDPL